MSPRKPAVLRDSGGDQTLREHLVATAARLIAERGSTGLTVRGIAREAKVADGVLYNHFADKEELLALALRAHVHTVMHGAGEVPRAGDSTVEDNLRAYVTRGLNVLTQILPVFAGVVAQHKILAHFASAHAPGTERGGLRAVLADYLRAEQQLGRLSPDAKVDAAATMMMGACHELILPRLFHPGPGAVQLEVPPGFVDDVVSTVLDGIAPRP
ncbi:TetR/AcrR family transcriptional regulator [Streptomyces sp. HC44]|uniref:TetR/AcrR family transcriptional regulator n=1 Tax=Streptomyces scabichelini TaxID=2711217 RepID=A0A6G4UY53_9ACTN|nr:TetR/AcrR family transcriptional regulator [Streptomyces scabichelini]NGO06656.1 TetR/AcrR family transcriptional regulator [Streptomyces scabichelini]